MDSWAAASDGSSSRGGAGRLAQLAGRADVDALEPRQLLFAGGPLVVPGPPGSLGQITAQFAYFVPYLAPTSEVDLDIEAETIVEDFSDVEGLNPNQGIPSGFTFPESNLRIFHNLPFAAANVVYRTNLDGDGAPIDGTERIEVTFRQPGDQLSIRPSVEDNPGVFLPVNSMRMSIGSGGLTAQPLDTDNTVVELLFQGQIVASYTGQSLRDLNTTGVGGTGLFNFVTGDPQNEFFDEVRFRKVSGGATNTFTIDNVEYEVIENPFAQVLGDRVHGVRFTFRAPAGATIEMYDLYNRPIELTLFIGAIPGTDFIIADPERNGVPNINDGIGRIVINGTNASSSLTMIGGLIEEEDNTLVFNLTESVVGEIDRLEGESGFGFRALPADDTFAVSGLPESGGSVVIGSPWVRPLGNYNPEGVAPGINIGQAVTSGFNRADQGVFVEGGSNIGRVDIFGFVHGSSRFTGTVGTFSAGVLLGSLDFAGDVRDIIVGGDAGVWQDDPGVDLPAGVVEGIFATGSRITIGRTIGEYLVAGRSAVDITVNGDLTDPDNVPARDVRVYFERERTIPISLESDEAAVMQALSEGPDLDGRFDVMFGNTLFANDAFLSAEYVGNAGTSVQIFGTLGGANPVTSAEDLSDVYAFPAAKGREIIIEIDAPAFFNVRVLDVDGRTLAALQGPDTTARLGSRGQVRFVAPHDGTFYLDIGPSGPIGGVFGEAGVIGDIAYQVLINGMAPVTFGSYRVGVGGNVPTGGVTNVNVRNGSMGDVRVGTSYLDGSRDFASPLEFINTNLSNDDDAIAFTRGSFSVAGNLYSVTAGGDIEGAGQGIRFFVGGDLGHVVTGLNPLAGATNDGLEGDVWGITFNVDGAAGFFDIRGAIGLGQDSDPDTIPGLPFVINTGLGDGTGDIGFIRVGSHVNANIFRVNTAPGSVVGGFVISQDLENETDVNGTTPGIFGGTAASIFNLGPGSDIRFVDFPQVSIGSSINATFPIVGGQPLEFVDDAGGRVRISVVGAPAGFNFGQVRVLPINGSQGVAVARIDIDLSGGFRLDITSLGPVGDTISIGQINITDASEGASIRIDGTNEIDVWRVRQTGGEAFTFIENITPGGDIVAIDVVGINRITVSGNLGSTRLPSVAPKHIGPFLGIASGLQTAVDGPLGIAADSMQFWNGGTYRPLRAIPGASGFADDHGAPFTPYLNGAVIRTGFVSLVSANGSIGDVILQGGAGTEVTSVIANANRTTPQGEFHGIVGSIYAHIINSVNVGDGLLGPGNGPLAEAGIFADDDIRLVLADVPGSNISGVIAAFNSDGLTLNSDGTFGVQGIDRIEVRSGGDFVNAFINTSTLHAFWSANTAVDDSNIVSGVVNNLVGLNADFRFSTISTFTLNSFRLTNGDFDASAIDTLSDALLIEASNFRNSTLAGAITETRLNVINAGRNMTTLRTLNNGDILDLDVTVVGRLTDRIEARNIARSTFGIANNANTILTTGSVGGSEFTFGSVNRFEVGTTLSASTITVSGPALEIRANVAIRNAVISIAGPDGRLDTLVTPGLLSGVLNSAGPVGRVESTGSDVRLRLTTTTARGTVNEIRAARDMELDADISARVNTISAGGNLGSRTVTNSIVLRDNLQDVTVGGQLYSDIRIGGNLTGTIGINASGFAPNLPGNSVIGSPNIVASGSINTVIIIGDFGGRIISHAGGIQRVGIVDGSLLPRASITAEAGSIDEIRIDRGNLYGNIHADYTIRAIGVFADDDGIFGDIGVNPNRSAFTPFSATRNQLPPGVIATSGINGPRITAGQNIGGIFTSNGSMFEAFVSAGRAIGTIWINGSITADSLTGGIPTVINAADSIFEIRVTGSIDRAYILAGVTGFGANGRPGGVGANADQGKSGKIYSIEAGSIANSVVAAGVSAGADGLYGTADDLARPGVSFVGAINAANVVSTSVVSDAFGDALAADARFNTASPALIDHPNANAPFVGTNIPSGGTLNIDLGAGEAATVAFTGPGEAVWDEIGRRVIFRNTNFASELRVTATGDTAQLTNFRIVGVNDASIGLIRVEGALSGDSNIYIDAYVQNVEVTGPWTGTGNLTVGEHATTVSLGSFLAGTISGPNIATLNVNGAFASAVFDSRGPSAIEIVSSAAININGDFRGRLFSEGTVGRVIIAGQTDVALIQISGSLGQFSTNSLRNTRLAITNSLNDGIDVVGDSTNTAIMFGVNLGREADFDSVSGAGNDSVRAGFANAPINIGGNFFRSNIVAGSLRGSDGFFNTASDLVTPGLSLISEVNIGGTGTGSNVFSESYAISSTGALGPVRIGEQTGQSTGNFQIRDLQRTPVPIQVVDLRVTSASAVFTGRIIFNQDMNAATLGQALTVTEVRGNQRITLVEDVDYFLEYSPADRELRVRFARAITERSLPQTDGLAGPGVYRFELDQAVLRAADQGARLDGDGDGVVEANDNFSQDNFVGDAGDRLQQQFFDVTDPLGRTITVDAYGPFPLDVVMDNNYSPDGLPDVNTPFTVRGVLGDHPDTDPSLFQSIEDVDLYSITLQAGQILRLGALTGPAADALRFISDTDGNLFFGFSADEPLRRLPGAPVGFDGTSFTDNYLVLETGTYVIGVANSFDTFDAIGPAPFADTGLAFNTTGNYTFTVEVFDDGNSGFSADTESGNGDIVRNAPPLSEFAGPDGVFGTDDDVQVVFRENYAFRVQFNEQGVPFVIGTNSEGITSVRDPQTGVLTSTVLGAIGNPNFAGVPNDVVPDLDVYHLNGRNPIDPGTRMRITLKLTEFGGDLGSRFVLEENSFSFVGNAILALFDTSNSTTVEDAELVFAPTDFSPNGGPANLTIADNGINRYGFDANGDFFIEFVLPGQDPATYAVYVQGAFNTDYALEIVTFPGSTFSGPRSQNVLIELQGGTVDWLEAGGLTTELDAFNFAALGFVGTVPDGRTIEQFVQQLIISNLDAVFRDSGFDVRFSFNPADFEFQDYSTVFITGSVDPITDNFDPFSGFGFNFIPDLGINPFADFLTNPYGYSQRSDPLNTDPNDEAVVFVPSLATLGYTPSTTGLTLFSQSLSAAVGRRVGELLGLRLNANDPFGLTGDILAANSVTAVPGLGNSYNIDSVARRLSDPFDSISRTAFYIGRQSSGSLLDKLLTTP
ncbi:MAG: hypothetical protein EA378_11415 [Phycisphaerales bacterium]|nr:MAG: hypothetical protein EA378_11415 [Phycisphaerales bacterium]